MLILLTLVLAAQEKIEDKKAANGMTYALRVPNSYDPKKGAPAFVVLHGSNMNGREYAETIERLGWLKGYVLIAPDGEEKSERAEGHNFSEGSAKLVKGVYDEVAAKIKVTRAFVIGHSQGGYLTYDVLMQYPDTFVGGIPMAATIWMRSEPSNWSGDDLEKRRGLVFAVIHGADDPVVDVQGSEYAHFTLMEAGVRALRFWKPDKVGHSFSACPVPEAVEWLEAMSAGDASKALKEGRWRDVSAVASKGIKDAAALKKKVDQAAAAAKSPLAKKMKGEGWLDDFYAFREAFQFADEAKPILKAYDEMRKSQEEPAKQLWERETKDEKAQRAKCEDVLKKFPASTYAFYARQALARRKP